ncbi:MAG: PilZ domain-containing protein [Myxococcales bacterium]|nr:PilZ domain-containing protein [Myxococcales bacterium]
MSTKRRHRRYRRRFLVKFGEKEPTSSGFTVDVSPGGAFISTPHLVPLDARVHVQLFLNPARSIYFEGQVCRHKVVPVTLRSVERGGFAVRFLSPAEALSEATGPRLELHFQSAEELRAAHQRELRMGGAFIPTQQPPPRDTELQLDLYLDFAGQAFEVDATVVYVSDPTGPTKGVGVSFDRQKLEEALMPFLA